MKKNLVKFVIILIAYVIIGTIIPANVYAGTKKINVSMSIGETAKLKVPNTKKIKWSTSNKKVVKISSAGTIKCLKKGKAIVRAKGKDITGKVISVRFNVSAQKIKNKTVTLNVGENKTLKLKKSTTFKSSNKKVANVTSKGKITAVKAGTAEITAKSITKNVSRYISKKTTITKYKVTVVEGTKKINGYSYEISPLLSPFNEYFFVKTDNPDPTSFRFIDKSSKYENNALIEVETDFYDSDKIKTYADVEYSNTKTGRVNGGYIFRSYATDGGEIVLQQKEGSGWYSSWTDTKVKIKLPILKDEADYLIDRFGNETNYFDKMDAIQEGFDSICFYSGSYIRGNIYKSGNNWLLASGGHIDQSFYIYSPYERKDSKSLFASALYPFRYDSLGFPGMMGKISTRLSSSASYKWSSTSHYLIEVTYGGVTRTYGGAGNIEGVGISEDKIKEFFSFNDTKKLNLTSLQDLLIYYSNIKMPDDIPRDGELTWKKICNDVGDGSWVRMNGSNTKINDEWVVSPSYAYMFKKDDKDYYNDSEWGIGYKNYYGGSLGYARDAWVDGRYVNEWRKLVPGESFEQHPTSDIILKNVNVPQITYRTSYKYNYEEGKYVKEYYDVEVREEPKTAIFYYDEDRKEWIIGGSAFDDECASYGVIIDLIEQNKVDSKYLDAITLTLDEVKALKVDQNTNKNPEHGFIYDGTVTPGTKF